MGVFAVPAFGGIDMGILGVLLGYFAGIIDYPQNRFEVFFGGIVINHHRRNTHRRGFTYRTTGREKYDFSYFPVKKYDFSYFTPCNQYPWVLTQDPWVLDLKVK